MTTDTTNSNDYAAKIAQTGLIASFTLKDGTRWSLALTIDGDDELCYEIACRNPKGEYVSESRYNTRRDAVRRLDEATGGYNASAKGEKYNALTFVKVDDQGRVWRSCGYQSHLNGTPEYDEYIQRASICGRWTVIRDDGLAYLTAVAQLVGVENLGA